MTAAITPKGERRRAALAAAAGELLVEGGFESVRHRAVAKRAHIPLAATTYYFESLGDLLSSAVSYASDHDLAAIRGRVAAVSRRRRERAALARLVSCVFFTTGSDSDRHAITSRYERLIVSARDAELTAIVAVTRSELADLHATVLELSGRHVDSECVARLMAVEDGAVLAALATPDADLAEVVRVAVADAINELAPLRD